MHWSCHELQSVGNRAGVYEPFLMHMAHGAPIRTSSRSKEFSKSITGKFDRRFGMSNQTVVSDEQILRVCRRFYVALILSRLVQVILFCLSLSICLNQPSNALEQICILSFCWMNLWDMLVD